MTHIADVRDDVKGQGSKVMSSGWCMFTNNWTTKSRSRRNTRIGTKVVYVPRTADIPHQFWGQNVTGQGHQSA